MTPGGGGFGPLRIEGIEKYPRRRRRTALRESQNIVCGSLRFAVDSGFVRHPEKDRHSGQSRALGVCEGKVANLEIFSLLPP